MKRLTTHGLRHTFASHLVTRGVPLVVVKEALGHADLSMVLRYSHLAPSTIAAAVQLLDERRVAKNGRQTAERRARRETQ